MTRLTIALVVAVVAIWGFAFASADAAHAAPGDFTVAPTNLAFPDTYVGESSTIVVQVTNVSGRTLTPNFAGGAPFDPQEFGGSQNCAGTTFAPGQSCQFTYEFMPTTLGLLSSSTTIGIDGTEFALSMRGTAVFPLSVAPTVVEFPDTTVGATSSIAVVITNISGAPKSPSFAGGAPIDATNFSGSQTCAGTTLNAGASCAFTYLFQPQTSGVHTSSTSIGVGDRTFSISLSGAAPDPNAPPITPTPTATTPDATPAATSSDTTGTGTVFPAPPGPAEAPTTPPPGDLVASGAGPELPLIAVAALAAVVSGAGLAALMLVRRHTR